MAASSGENHLTISWKHRHCELRWSLTSASNSQTKQTSHWSPCVCSMTLFYVRALWIECSFSVNAQWSSFANGTVLAYILKCLIMSLCIYTHKSSCQGSFTLWKRQWFQHIFWDVSGNKNIIIIFFKSCLCLWVYSCTSLCIHVF